MWYDQGTFLVAVSCRRGYSDALENFIDSRRNTV